MAKVICTLYGRYHDRKTGIEFRPELVDGRYVGVAIVEDPKALRHFSGRDGFVVVEEPKPKATKGPKRKDQAAAESEASESASADEGEGEKSDAGDGETAEE